MIKTDFYPSNKISDELIKFVVISTRSDGKWVMCRHRDRDTWEIPGGHRENGESIEAAARRELYEETGAVCDSLVTVSAYGVSDGEATTYGMLFFADVKEMGAIPDGSEIAERSLFSTMPKDLTYPNIQPDLFGAVQAWINTQNSPDELWDVYDENRSLTGRLHKRSEPLAEGDYHLVVHVWIIDSDGRFLITKRTPNKGFPNMWEATGGSAQAGDDSLSAAVREVREETALQVEPENGRVAISFRRHDNFVDVWLFKQDLDVSKAVLLEGETCGIMYATEDDIRRLHADGKFVPFSYLDEILRIARDE